MCASFFSSTTPCTSAIKFLKQVALNILCSVIDFYSGKVNLIFITTSWSELEVYLLLFISMCILFPSFLNLLLHHGLSHLRAGIIYTFAYDILNEAKRAKKLNIIDGQRFFQPYVFNFFLNKDDSAGFSE